MSENSLTKLREAINRRLRVRTGLTTAVEFDEASLGLQAALAAVEQEIAALEAERDELRKRPTRKEVTRAIWEDAPMGLDGNGIRIEVARNVDKLFDGKAAQ